MSVILFLLSVPLEAPQNLTVHVNNSMLMIRWEAPPPDKLNGILQRYEVTIKHGTRTNKVSHWVCQLFCVLTKLNLLNSVFSLTTLWTFSMPLFLFRNQLKFSIIPKKLLNLLNDCFKILSKNMFDIETFLFTVNILGLNNEYIKVTGHCFFDVFTIFIHFLCSSLK